MSALLRPHGDNTILNYGPYKTKKEVEKISKGDKLDILCSDGLNYHAEVKEAGVIGRLHFCHWSTRSDYIGSFNELYIASHGTYSKGISAQNTYPALVKTDSRSDKTKVVSSTKSTGNNSSTDSRPTNFPKGTRYPNEYLSKPRFPASNSRKRTGEELVDFEARKASKNNEISVPHLKLNDNTGQSIADEAFKKTSVISNGIDDKSMAAHDRRDKSNGRNRRSLVEIKDTIQVDYLNSLSSADSNTQDAIDQIDNNMGDTVATASLPGKLSEIRFTAHAPTINEGDGDKLSTIVIEVLSSSSSSANSQSDSKISTAASNCESATAVLQVARVTPDYQIQLQRAAQLKHLRDMLGMEKSITDTGRAIDTIKNHSNLFNSGISSSQYTAQQIVLMLQAKKKLDEAVSDMLQ